MVLGLVTYAVFVGCDPLLSGKISAYDQIFPHLVMTLFETIPVLRGLFLSTVFAAALRLVLSAFKNIDFIMFQPTYLGIFALRV